MTVTSGALVEIAGQPLWVEQRGEPSQSTVPVVFVHGLGGTVNVFDPQLEAIAATHHVVAFDLAGHGLSPLGSTTSIESWAGHVVAVADHLGAERFHLIGHSLGTLVVQAVVAGHHERVASVVALGPIRQLPDTARTAQRDRAATVRREGMAGVAHAISRVAVSGAVAESHPTTVAFVRELLMRQNAEGYAAACEALGASVPPRVEHYAGRVLAITGSDDGVSPAAALDAFANEFASATTSAVIIDDIGHWTSIEAPLRVTQLLTEFLSTSD